MTNVEEAIIQQLKEPYSEHLTKCILADLTEGDDDDKLFNKVLIVYIYIFILLIV